MVGDAELSTEEWMFGRRPASRSIVHADNIPTDIKVIKEGVVKKGVAQNGTPPETLSNPLLRAQAHRWLGCPRGC